MYVCIFRLAWYLMNIFSMFRDIHRVTYVYRCLIACVTAVHLTIFTNKAYLMKSFCDKTPIFSFYFFFGTTSVFSAVLLLKTRSQYTLFYFCIGRYCWWMQMHHCKGSKNRGSGYRHCGYELLFRLFRWIPNIYVAISHPNTPL